MLVAFSRPGGAIVTGPAITHDALMIKSCISKRRGPMAHRTIFGGRNVSGIDLGLHACRVDSIVARRTVIDDTGMIKHRRCERATGHVTDTAILVRDDMVGPVIHACRINTVVAGITPVIRDVRACMVNKRRGEIGRVVANRTISDRVLMNW